MTLKSTDSCVRGLCRTPVPQQRAFLTFLSPCHPGRSTGEFPTCSGGGAATKSAMPGDQSPWRVPRPYLMSIFFRSLAGGAEKKPNLTLGAASFGLWFYKGCGFRVKSSAIEADGQIRFPSPALGVDFSPPSAPSLSELCVKSFPILSKYLYYLIIHTNYYRLAYVRWARFRTITPHHHNSTSTPKHSISISLVFKHFRTVAPASPFF
jgi:hypothetical protein